ncbi:hypothetical protein C8J57DRAFT_1535366 [Mycena rebaudengoi]|nr:hypothetical protein C8J57DRAFT_1535366 [Mycena rebaudengoi]
MSFATCRPLSHLSWKGRAPTLAGPLVEFYDINEKTKVVGHSFVTQSIRRKHQTLIARPRQFGDIIFVYHQLWRALVQGYDPPNPPSATGVHATSTQKQRPALPIELVHLIVRAAGLIVPDKQQTKHAECGVLVRATAPDGSSPISRVWFWTKPLVLAKVAAVQLVTVSRSAGRPTPNDVAWFEWGVFSGGAPLREAASTGPMTGNEEAWRMRSSSGRRKDDLRVWHRTHLDRPIWSNQQTGSRLGIYHEIFAGATEGSIIAVRACAQEFPADNDARYGEIWVWK